MTEGGVWRAGEPGGQAAGAAQGGAQPVAGAAAESLKGKVMLAEGVPRQQGSAPCPRVLLQRDCKLLPSLPEGSPTAAIHGSGSALSPAQHPGENLKGGW